MNFKKTVVASAVLLAAGSAFAFEVPDFPQTFDRELVQSNDTNQNTGLTNFEDIGIVKPMEGNNGAGSPSFMFGNSNVTLTNTGTIWVVAGDLTEEFGEDFKCGNYVNGFTANNGATAVNKGTIIVKSNAKFSSGSRNYNSAKGMQSDGQGKLINGGTIYVDGGVAMNISTTADGQVVENNGTIIVKEGYGIAFNREKESGEPSTVKITNIGTIEVQGDKAVGVILDQSMNGGTFVNEGKIEGSGYGIVTVGSQDLTIQMKGASQITADMLLDETTDLKVDNLKSAQTISINTADQIDVVGSNLTIESTNTNGVLKVNTLSTDADSSATFRLSRMGTEQEKVLEVNTVTGEGNIDVAYTGSVSDELAGGADANNLFNGVKLGDQTLDNVTVAEGVYGDGAVYTKDEQGNVVAHVTSTNSLLTSAHDLAMANAYMWRSELTSLSDRMGTLRTLPETAGAWARYTGGSFDGDRFNHDYNTIEIGLDKSIAGNFLLGASFNYTKGESDLIAGNADNDNYSVGLYASYFHEKGSFLDAMFKFGRVEADYCCAMPTSPKTESTA